MQAASLKPLHASHGGMHVERAPHEVGKSVFCVCVMSDCRICCAEKWCLSETTISIYDAILN